MGVIKKDAWRDSNAYLWVFRANMLICRMNTIPIWEDCYTTEHLRDAFIREIQDMLGRALDAIKNDENTDEYDEQGEE